MKIGDLQLDACAPDVERLLASTGQTVAAMRQLLEHSLPCGLVAAALHACLNAEHEIHDLAVEIERAGVEEIRALVRDLFAEPPAAELPAKKGKKE